MSKFSSQHKSLQKIIILGAQGCGKTSLMERFVAAKFSSQYKATIGADFSTKDVQVGDELVTLQIWDTAGQERYQSLGTAFYRGADACVLVYDVSEAVSFQKLEQWRNAFITAADIANPKDFPFVILGNKSDLEAAKQVVQPSSVAAWAASKGDIPTFQVRQRGPRRARSLAPPSRSPISLNPIAVPCVFLARALYPSRHPPSLLPPPPTRARRR